MLSWPVLAAPATISSDQVSWLTPYALRHLLMTVRRALESVEAGVSLLVGSLEVVGVVDSSCCCCCPSVGVLSTLSVGSLESFEVDSVVVAPCFCGTNPPPPRPDR